MQALGHFCFNSLPHALPLLGCFALVWPALFPESTGTGRIPELDNAGSGAGPSDTSGAVARARVSGSQSTWLYKGTAK